LSIVILLSTNIYFVSTIGENIKLLRNGREYKEFAAWLSPEGKVDKGNLSKYEKNKIKPTFEFFYAAAKRNINLNWLLTGKGEMYVSDNKNDDLLAQINKLNQKVHFYKNEIGKVAEKINSIYRVKNKHEKSNED